MQEQDIPVYSKEDFDGMRKAGSLAAKVLDKLMILVQPGISTLEINDFCHQTIIDNDATPAPLNYKGFPKSICTSVNHVVCHGIPSQNKILQNGDIINIDVTVILDGWYGDSSRMFAAGKINTKTLMLLKTTYESLMRGIQVAKPGNFVGDIGHEIQIYAESKKCSVVKDFCGHGTGRLFHEPPSILHYGNPKEGTKIE